MIVAVFLFSSFNAVSTGKSSLANNYLLFSIHKASFLKYFNHEAGTHYYTYCLSADPWIRGKTLVSITSVRFISSLFTFSWTFDFSFSSWYFFLYFSIHSFFSYYFLFRVFFLKASSGRQFILKICPIQLVFMCRILFTSVHFHPMRSRITSLLIIF